MPDPTLPTTQQAPAAVSPQSATSSFMSGLADGMKGMPDIGGARPEPEPVVQTPATQQAAPADTKPAAQPDGDEKWPRSAQDWDKFKSARKEKETALAKQLQERDAKILDYETKLKTASTAPADYETIKGQLSERERQANEYSELLKQTALERHPQFKAYFESKTNSQVDIAKRILGEEPAKRLKHVIGMDDGQYKKDQLRQLTAELEPLEMAQIGNVITSIEQVNAERNQVLSNSRVEYDAMVKKQSDDSTKAAQQRTQAMEGTFQAVLSKVGEYDMFKKRDGDEAWNTGIDAEIAAAKQLVFGQNKNEDLVQAAIAAAAIPRMVKMGQEKDAQITKLQEQIKQLTAASPRLPNGDGSGNAAPAKPALKPGMRPMEASKSFGQDMVRAMEEAGFGGR